MSREVVSAVVRGARAFVDEAEAALTKAIAEKGEKQPVEFPGTAFQLPMTAALMGIEATRLEHLKGVLAHCRELVPADPTDALWLPYLGGALDSGIATLLAMEITTAIRYLYGETVEQGFTGFISDTILRELGIQLVDGSMPGFAVIIGKAPTDEIAVEIA